MVPETVKATELPTTLADAAFTAEVIVTLAEEMVAFPETGVIVATTVSPAAKPLKSATFSSRLT